MKRKAIQLANQTIVVSLPAKWVREQGIKKGDEIDIEENKSQLIISSESKALTEKKIIDISKIEKTYKRIMGAALKAGYSEIEIKFNSYKQLKIIEDHIRFAFSTFTIANQTKDSIILKRFYKDDYENYESVLKRYFLLNNYLAEETGKAFEKNDFDWMKQNTIIKSDLNRLADYCRRSINLNSNLNFKRPAPLYTIIEVLLDNASAYREACNYAADEKIKIHQNLKKFVKEIANYQNQFYNLFYNFSLEKNEEFAIQYGSIQKKLDELDLEVSKKELKLLHFFEVILLSLYRTGGTITTLYI